MDSNKCMWKSISRYLKVAKNSSKEDDYQSAIYDIFLEPDFLGWPENRVIREYPVQMGSTKRSDMVLLDSNNNPIIAIEVKLADSAHSGVQQLGSYMNGCKPRMKFGLTFKGYINIFYDEDYGHSLNSVDDAVLSAKIGDSDDLNGVEVVDLLYFPTFSLDRLSSFCKNTLDLKRKDELRNQSIRRIREWIESVDKSEILVEALTEYLNSHLPAVLEKLDINKSIIREALSSSDMLDVQNRIDSVEKTESSVRVNSSQSKHKYLFNGKIIEGQACLVKEIFEKYSNETNCSSDELLNIIRENNITKSAVKKEKDILERRRQTPVQRETYPEQYSFKTCDGVSMRVFTDFNNKEGHDTLKPVIDFARNKGWNVEILS